MTKLLAALAVAALCTALSTHVGAITEASICKAVGNSKIAQFDCLDHISACCEFFDGCNVCKRGEDGEFACTEKVCKTKQDVKCQAKPEYAIFKKSGCAKQPAGPSREEQEKQCAAHGEDCGKCVSDTLCYMMTTGKCQSAKNQVADAAIYSHKLNGGDAKKTCTQREAQAKDDKICAAKAKSECTECKATKTSTGTCVAFEGGGCASSGGMRQALERCPASDGCCDFFDGCNACTRKSINDQLVCTKKACNEPESSKCNKMCKKEPVCPSAADICAGKAKCAEGCPCPGCEKPPAVCANKKCGEVCSNCKKGEMCPSVMAYCQADGGECKAAAKPTEEACSKPVKPCASKKCGEVCSNCKKGEMCATVVEYCQTDGGECKATAEPTEEACSKPVTPKCPAATDICSGKAKCAKDCPCPKCAPIDKERVACCMGMSASCLACKAGTSQADYCKANPKTDGCKPSKCAAVRCAEGSKHVCCGTKQKLAVTMGLLKKAEAALAASSCFNATATAADCDTLFLGLEQAMAALAAAKSEAATAEAEQGAAVSPNATAAGTTVGTNSSADATTLPNVAATTTAAGKVSAVELATAAKNVADKAYKDAGCVEDPDKEGCAALKKAQAAANAALEKAKEDEGSPAAAVASAAAAVAAGVVAAALM